MSKNIIQQVQNSIKIHGVPFTLQMIRFKLIGGSDPRNTPEFIVRMQANLEPAFFLEDLKPYYTDADSLSEEEVLQLRRALLSIDSMYAPYTTAKRINLVLDHLNKKAFEKNREILELTASYAKKYGYHLRVITRSSAVNAAIFYNETNALGIQLPEYIEFFNDIGRNNYGDCQYKLTVTEKDVFIVTNWYSAIALKGTTIHPHLYFYVDQSNLLFSKEQNDLYFSLFGKNTHGLIPSKKMWAHLNENYPHFVKQSICLEDISTEEFYEFMENHT